jgi:hypothetical protein
MHTLNTICANISSNYSLSLMQSTMEIVYYSLKNDVSFLRTMFKIMHLI